MVKSSFSEREQSSHSTLSGNMSYALGEMEVMMVMTISCYRAWMITKSRSERSWVTDYHVYGVLVGLTFLSVSLPVIMTFLPGKAT